MMHQNGNVDVVSLTTRIWMFVSCLTLMVGTAAYVAGVWLRHGASFPSASSPQPAAIISTSPN